MDPFFEMEDPSLPSQPIIGAEQNPPMFPDAFSGDKQFPLRPFASQLPLSLSHPIGKIVSSCFGTNFIWRRPPW